MQKKLESVENTVKNKKILVMAAYYLPSILVPLVGLVFPALTMGALFLYIEKEDVV